MDSQYTNIARAIGDIGAKALAKLLVGESVEQYEYCCVVSCGLLDHILKPVVTTVDGHTFAIDQAIIKRAQELK